MTAILLAAPANAVIKGTASLLGAYTVRLTGSGYCNRRGDRVPRLLV